MEANVRPTLRVGIVGCGRVGAVLGAALRRAGHVVVATSAVSDASLARAADLLPGVPVVPPDEVVRRSDVVLLTVPDDEIASVAAGFARLGLWDEPRLVAHTAGALGLAPLQPVLDRGGMAFVLHPAMAFSGEVGDLDRLVGTIFTVTGADAALVVAQSLVMDLDGEPVVLRDEVRAAFHAALTHASTHTCTLLAQALEVLRACEVDDPARVLRPLMAATVENAVQRGDRALVGAVSRGDVGTVADHLEALQRVSPEVCAAYRVMARSTAERAIAHRQVPAERVPALLALLAPEPDST